MGTSPKPKFVVTPELARLARWLRMLGYDALCYKKVSFIRLFSLAQKENRILLTRSEDNAKCKHRFKRRLIKSDDYRRQLAELKDIISFSEAEMFSRCLLCNQPISMIDKEKIKNKVPDYVYEHHDDFGICHKCGRIYWPGTHFENMKKELMKIFQHNSRQ
jgi:hypothetical protein